MSPFALSWINKESLWWWLPLALSLEDKRSPSRAPCILAVSSLSPVVYLESPGFHMSGGMIVESRSGGLGTGWPACSAPGCSWIGRAHRYCWEKTKRDCKNELEMNLKCCLSKKTIIISCHSNTNVFKWNIFHIVLATHNMLNLLSTRHTC